MPRTIHTHCALRLGDNLAHLHFLRALAKRHPDIHFVHAAELCYLQQLIEVVADLPNLQLRDIRHCHGDYSINAWKNAGGFWENHPLKNDYGPFMLAWFATLAERMELPSPFDSAGPASQLLFDYPALEKKRLNAEPFDVLVINSQPMSGQFRGYNPEALAALALRLAKHRKVITTAPVQGLPCTQAIPGFSVTNIGQLSQLCETIVMVSTGPSWPTFNVWNAETVKLRLVLIDSERVNLAPHTEHCASVEEAARVLRFRGLI